MVFHRIRGFGLSLLGKRVVQATQAVGRHERNVRVVRSADSHRPAATFRTHSLMGHLTDPYRTPSRTTRPNFAVGPLAAMFSSLNYRSYRAGLRSLHVVTAPHPETKETAEACPIELDGSILDTDSEPFVPHEQDTRYSSYLAMAIPYAPVQTVFETVRDSGYPHLTNRSEGHITVITPVEFDSVLKDHLTIGEIHEMADSAHIQSMSFSVEGMGSGTVSVDGNTERVFFLVVKSDALLNLRRKVHQKFVEKGGDPDAFDPEAFNPHITVGYTLRDLHASDGVIKDVYSLDPLFPFHLNPSDTP
jgi:2'-5' RNA ligase